MKRIVLALALVCLMSGVSFGESLNISTVEGWNNCWSSNVDKHNIRAINYIYGQLELYELMDALEDKIFNISKTTVIALFKDFIDSNSNDLVGRKTAMSFIIFLNENSFLKADFVEFFDSRE